MTRSLLLTLLAGCLSASAWALEAQHIDLGGFELTPTLEVQERYDDNFRALKSAPQSSWITAIEPRFLLSAEDRNSAYQLEYRLDDETFHSDSQASNTDHHLYLRSVLEFSSRQRLRWDLEYHRQEDTIDTADAQENDKYSRAIAKALYSFGANTAANQLDFGVNYEALRYHNSGDLNADKERDSLRLNGIWFHRLGGVTRSLIEIRHTEHDYKLTSSPRSGTNHAALAGITWDPTAKTTGSLRVGIERKDFDSNANDDYTSPMWEVGLAWRPRTYSTITLDTRRAFDEGDDGASTIAEQSARLGWEHEWSTRIRSELYYRYTEREYKGIDRDDDRNAYGLSLIYSPRRWIDLTLGYRYQDNDSTLRSESFTRNVYLLGVALSL